ncbi:response regulator transcription factor [Thiorhodovibrio winogradskyi]|nr:response regulator transcription factor [Thiorhodovibrio winogradskyi]
MPDIPILLVEDDLDLCEVLSEYLELHGYQVTTANSGRDFYRALDLGHAFQVAIIDLGLPDQPGQVLAEYARQNTAMSVVIITANDALDNRIGAFQSGVDLFIAKPLDTRELLAAVSAMAARYSERQALQPANPPALPGTGVWRLKRPPRQLISPAGGVMTLTQRESDIVALFARVKDGHVERQAMLQAIYNREDRAAQRALDNLIRRLRVKLEAATGHPAPIVTAYGQGHTFSEPLVMDSAAK